MGSNQNCVKALIIDNSPKVVKELTDILGRSKLIQFEVSHAENLDAAFKMLSDKFDVLLFNLDHTAGHDFDALHRLYTRARQTPLVVLSADQPDDSFSEAVSDIAYSIVVKSEMSRIAIDHILLNAIEINDLKRVTEKKTEQLQELEIQLRTMQRQYSLILDNQTEGIGLFDLDEKFIFCNIAAEKIIGVERGDLIGKSLGEFTDEETFSNIRRRISNQEEPDKEDKFAIEINRVDDEKRHLNVTLKPWFDELKNPVGTFIVFTDVTEQVLTEKAMRESEMKHRLLLSSIHSPVVALDEEMNILYFNDPYADFINHPFEDLIGKNLLEMVPDFEKSEKYKVYKNVLFTGNTDEIVSSCGEIYTHEWVYRSPWGIISFAEDITKRLKAEEKLAQYRDHLEELVEQRTEELRESELEALAILNSSDDPIVLVDREGKVLAANTAFAEGVKKKTEDVLNRNMLELLPPERMNFRLRRFGYVINTCKPLAFEDSHGELHIWVSYFPIVDENNRVTKVAIFIRDITERKRAVDALQESERKYRDVINNSTEGIYIIQDYAVRFCNQRFAEMFGYETAEDVSGKHLSGLFSPESWDSITKQLREAFSGVKRYDQSYFTASRLDGSQFEVGNLCNKIVYQGKDAVQGTIRDVSEQRSLEAQLRQSQKMDAVGRLAGGVAHDFNNLLTVIYGNTELTLMKLPPDDPLKGFVEQTHKAAVSAGNLTRQLLAFSRKQPLKPQVVDLNQILEDMTKMLKRLIGADMELVSNKEDDLWKTLVDPGQMEQVIVNLVVNSRDAMPQGGIITLNTKNFEYSKNDEIKISELKPGKYVLLTESDNGTGMPDEVRAKIFDPFFTTKESGKGTGLGLSTVYGIVNQSGGHITVESEMGVGTTFKIYLPMTEGEVEDKAAVIDDAFMPHGDENVFIVEDHEQLLNLMVNSLKHLSYNVYEANSPKAALRKGRRIKEQIDLLITDVILPHMNGPELAAELREKRWHDMKILFISGHTENLSIQEDRPSEGSFFMQKPFTIDDLARKVRGVLDSE